MPSTTPSVNTAVYSSREQFTSWFDSRNLPSTFLAESSSGNDSDCCACDGCQTRVYDRDHQHSDQGSPSKHRLAGSVRSTATQAPAAYPDTSTAAAGFSLSPLDLTQSSPQASYYGSDVNSLGRPTGVTDDDVVEFLQDKKWERETHRRLGMKPCPKCYRYTPDPETHDCDAVAREYLKNLAEESQKMLRNQHGDDNVEEERLMQRTPSFQLERWLKDSRY